MWKCLEEEPSLSGWERWMITSTGHLSSDQLWPEGSGASWRPWRKEPGCGQQEPQSSQSHGPRIWLRMPIMTTINVIIFLQSLRCYCCCLVTQSCLTLRPLGLQLARLPCPLLFPGVSSNSCPLSAVEGFFLLRSFVERVYVQLLSHVQVFVAPQPAARQAPLSMGVPRQEHWRGWTFPSLRDLFNPGIKSESPALAGGFFTTEPPGKSVERVTPICSSHSFCVLRGSGRKGSHPGLQQTEVEEAFSHSAGSVEPWHATQPLHLPPAMWGSVFPWDSRIATYWQLPGLSAP